MRLYYVWKVAYKELLSTFRDRRTLRTTILLPLILIPLFTVGLPLLLGSLLGGQQTARQTLGVVNLKAMPAALKTMLTEDQRDRAGQLQSTGVRLTSVADPLAAVQSGKVDAALVLPANLANTVQSGSVNTVRLYTKLGNLRSSSGVTDKVQSVLERYNTSLVTARLRALKLSPDFLTPVRLDTVDASTAAEKRGGQLAFIIPMFMLQFILAGATATAVDSTAGEKERGTLEVLLVTPIRRVEVVVGKLLATTLFALVTAAFSVIGLALAAPLALLLNRGGSGAALQASMGGTLSLGAADLGVLLLMVLSVALLISGLLIAVAIYARSYKEAQTYIAPITIFIVIPAVLLQFADFLGRSAALYAIPLVNAMLVILDLVKGSLRPDGVLLALAVNLLATALVAYLALRSFGREQVIFRN